MGLHRTSSSPTCRRSSAGRWCAGPSARASPRAVRPAVIHTRGDQRAATAHAFGVHVGILFAHAACVSAPTIPPVKPPAAAPAAVATSQPAATTGPTPGNGEQPEACEQAGCAADGSANAGAFARTFGTVVNAIAVAIDALGCAVAREPVVRIVGHDADVAALDAGGFEVTHRLLGTVIGRIEFGDHFRHVVCCPYWVTTLPWKSSLTLTFWLPFVAVPVQTPLSSFFRPETLV